MFFLEAPILSININRSIKNFQATVYCIYLNSFRICSSFIFFFSSYKQLYIKLLIIIINNFFVSHKFLKLKMIEFSILFIVFRFGSILILTL